MAFGAAVIDFTQKKARAASVVSLFEIHTEVNYDPSKGAVEGSFLPKRRFANSLNKTGAAHMQIAKNDNVVSLAEVEEVASLEPMVLEMVAGGAIIVNSI